ncbi:MAG: type II toxin-antitoxin system RelE/ParE family toxin, partial [Nitrospinota bacterium]
KVGNKSETGLGNKVETRQEFPDLPFREVIVVPYRFFYHVKGKTVWIVAVWHGAQAPKEPNETENV